MGDLITTLPTDKVQPSEAEKQAVLLLFPPTEKGAAAKSTKPVATSSSPTLASASSASSSSSFGGAVNGTSGRTSFFATILTKRFAFLFIAFVVLTAPQSQPWIAKLLGGMRVQDFISVHAATCLLFVLAVVLASRL